MTKYHGVSFIISSIIYVALGFLFLNFLDAKKPIPKPKERVIKIALLRPIPKIITPPTPVVAPIIPPLIIPPQKIVSSKPKPITPKVSKRIKKRRNIKKRRKVKKKSVKKRRVKKRRISKKRVKKKRVLKKPRKIKKRVIKKKRVKKRVVKKRVHKKKVVKKHVIKRPVIKPTPRVREPEPIIEEIYYPPIVQEERYTPPPRPRVVKRVVPKAVPLPVYTPPPPKPAPKVDNRGAKRAFLTQVRSQIINNKRYPKLALRRHIEGSVTVRFNIGSSGDVSNIRFISGKTILQKAVRKAIIQSFPMGVPSSLRSELPINNVSLTVNFSIN